MWRAAQCMPSFVTERVRASRKDAKRCPSHNLRSTRNTAADTLYELCAGMAGADTSAEEHERRNF